MEFTHYGVVEIKNISSDLVDELTPFAIKEYKCSGVQNQEVTVDELDNIDEVPADLLTMSGEFTDDQSDLVNAHFFSNNQEKVSFFFEGSIDEISKNANEFVSFLKTNMNISSSFHIKENEDWRDSYKKYFTHAIIDEELVVLPDWNVGNSDFNKFERKLLLIPGMGFGTGGHETTRLCLRILNKMNTTKSVLDFGCGSGVLGNFCELYLGSYVDYVDVDSDALDNCLENRTLNNLKENGNVLLRSKFISNKKYSVVIANILKPVLESESDLILSSVAEDGEIIFSGLLREQYNDLLDFYKNKYSIRFEHEVFFENDWVAVRVFKIKGRD
jgi:ribosomal protein L11 methyltransferase